MQFNIDSADTSLSDLVNLIATKKEEVIVITRSGKLTAKTAPFEESSASPKIGIAKGKLESSIDFEEDDEEIASLFGLAR